MDEQSKRKRPTYGVEFKQDAVRLVVEEGYSFKAVCAMRLCVIGIASWLRRPIRVAKTRRSTR